MTLDARIPLMGNQLEAQQVKNNRLAQLAQQDIQKKKLAMDEQAQGQQMQMNEEQMVQQRLNNLDAREKSRFQSTVLGAAQLVPYLEENDVAGAEAFLMTRKKNLQNRIAAGENIDTAETDAALKQLRENPQALKQSLGKLLQVGRMAGVLDTPKDEGFSLSPGQKRYDGQGNLIAESAPNGGMVASTDPVTGEVTYGATRKLSASDQKEVYEASDIIQNANSAKGALTRADSIRQGKTGAEPYSGFGAGARAGLARLPDWLVPDAIASKERGAATTEYSTLVNEQALSNLKAIFGGNPTEGERSILLQMQAIADYTPEEQERIIKNAISAADRRINFNQGKIKSIQTGDYGALGTTPQQSAQPKGIEGAEETKVIGGVEYHKVNGKWVTQ